MWNQWPGVNAPVPPMPTGAVPPQPPLPDAPPPPPPSGTATTAPIIGPMLPSSTQVTATNQLAIGSTVPSAADSNSPYGQYTAAQYAAMTPEQQYALQQHWQQWQAYQQEYAKWHAQYGEQYKREMAAAANAVVSNAPYPGYYQPSQSQTQPQTSMQQPPPPPSDANQKQSSERNITGQPQMYTQSPQVPNQFLQPPPPSNQPSSLQQPWPQSNNFNAPSMNFNQPPPNFNQQQSLNMNQYPSNYPPHANFQQQQQQQQQQHSQQRQAHSQIPNNNLRSGSNNISARPPVLPSQQQPNQQNQQSYQQHSQPPQQSHLMPPPNWNNERCSGNNTLGSSAFSGLRGPTQTFDKDGEHNKITVNDSCKNNVPAENERSEINQNNQRHFPDGRNDDNRQWGPNRTNRDSAGPANNQADNYRFNNNIGFGVNEDFNDRNQWNNRNNMSNNRNNERFNNRGNNSNQSSGNNWNNNELGNWDNNASKNFDNSRNFGNHSNQGNFGNQGNQNFRRGDNPQLNRWGGNNQNFGPNNAAPNSNMFGNNRNDRSVGGTNRNSGPHDNQGQNDRFGPGFNQNQRNWSPNRGNMNRQQQQQQQPPQQRVPELDEESFDRQFQQWEQQFEDWKNANANHPDFEMYTRYKQEFEKQRKRIMERREHMRKRKMEQMAKQMFEPLESNDATNRSPLDIPSKSVTSTDEETLNMQQKEIANTEKIRDNELKVSSGDTPFTNQENSIKDDTNITDQTARNKSFLDGTKLTALEPLTTEPRTSKEEDSPTCSNKVNSANNITKILPATKTGSDNTATIPSGSNITGGRRKSRFNTLEVQAIIENVQNEIISLVDEPEGESTPDSAEPISTIFNKVDDIPGLDLVDDSGVNTTESHPQLIAGHNTGIDGPTRPPKVAAMENTTAKKIPSLFDVVVEKPITSPTSFSALTSNTVDHSKSVEPQNMANVKTPNITSIPDVANALQDPVFMQKISQALAKAQGKVNAGQEPASSGPIIQQPHIVLGQELKNDPHDSSDGRPLSFAEWQRKKGQLCESGRTSVGGNSNLSANQDKDSNHCGQNIFNFAADDGSNFGGRNMADSSVGNDGNGLNLDLVNNFNRGGSNNAANRLDFSGISRHFGPNTGPNFGGNGPNFGGNGPNLTNNRPNFGGNGPNFNGNGPNFGGNNPAFSGPPNFGGNRQNFGPNFRGNGPNFGGNGSNFGGNGPNFGNNGQNRGGNGPNFGGNGGPNFGGGGPNFNGNGPNFRGGYSGNSGGANFNFNQDEGSSSQNTNNPFRRSGGPKAPVFEESDVSRRLFGRNDGSGNNSDSPWMAGPAARNRYDDYFRPTQVIDYENNTKPPTKVIDYGHKTTPTILNPSSATGFQDVFKPMQTFDYGHASKQVQVVQKPALSSAGLNPRNVKKKKRPNRNRNKKNQNPNPNQNQNQNQNQIHPQNQKQNSNQNKNQNRNQNLKENQCAVGLNTSSFTKEEGDQVSEGNEQQDLHLTEAVIASDSKGNMPSVKSAVRTVATPSDTVPIEVCDELPLEQNFEEISDGEDDMQEFNNKEDNNGGSPAPPPPPVLSSNQLFHPIEKTFFQTSIFPSTAAANNDLKKLRENQEQQSVQMTFPSVENCNTITIDEILLKPGRQSRPKRICVILRGPPGSGKSHVAKLIKDKEIEMGGENIRILSIDDYFTIENEYEDKCPKTGKTILKKEILYEYDKEYEETYMQYLIKAFKKTIADHLYDFIIIDCNNNSLRTLNEFYCHSKDSGFVPYIIDLLCDVEKCLERNIHERTESDIRAVIESWKPTPLHYIKLDVSSLLENVIEMEDAEDMVMDDNSAITTDSVNVNQLHNSGYDEEDDSQEATDISCDFLKSKWENDNTTDNLARLDGTSKLAKKRKATTMDDYLQIDDWEPPKITGNGKKRVRWADIEERRAQDKMRAIGFVVGQTDWNRMMDPNAGEKLCVENTDKCHKMEKLNCSNLAH